MSIWLSSLFQFFGGIFLGVELSNHIVILCLTFWGSTTLFHSGCTIWHSQQLYKGYNCSTSWQHLLIFKTIIAIFVGIKWYLIMISICVSLISNSIEVLSGKSVSSVTQSCLLFAIPWTAAHQASLSITNSWSWLKLMSIESVMPSNHLILCHPLLLLLLKSFPGSFPMNQFFTSGGQSIVVSASASVLPMNIQDWFPLGWTG